MSGLARTSRKVLVGAAVGMAIGGGFALVSSLSNSNTAASRAQVSASEPARAKPGPLSAVKSPPIVLKGLVSQARNAGITQLATAGVAGDTVLSRSIVIGRNHSGRPEAAIVDTDGHSSFMTPSEIFRDAPLSVFSSQAGTATAVGEASIAVFTRPEVSRVTVERTDGRTHEATLTSWPVSGFASFSEVAADPQSFPRIVRAYAADGTLLATSKTDIGPLCRQSAPNCIK